MDAFHKVGFHYDEAEKRVHSVARAHTQRKRIQAEFATLEEMRAELKAGCARAKASGIDVSYLEREYSLGNPLLTGRLLIDNMIEAPEVERIFAAMSAAGLIDQTMEAILLKHEGLAKSLIPDGALQIARKRIARVQG